MAEERELQARRFHELALRAAHSQRMCLTRFLEPALEADARAAAAQAGVQVYLWGGYEGAERRVAAFAQEEPPAEDFPIAALELSWNDKFSHPGHRDLLGAVMGLGLEREATGDIAPARAAGSAYLFVLRDVADYVCANLDSAGRASLKVRAVTGEIAVGQATGETMRITVANERLDSVLAAGFRLSRGQAQQLIGQGLVKRNHVEERRGDVRMAAGDLISTRGFGRLRLVQIEGETRKGRIALSLFRYTD